MKKQICEISASSWFYYKEIAYFRPTQPFIIPVTLYVSIGNWLSSGVSIQKSSHKIKL